jgi:hypothetical protein
LNPQTPLPRYGLSDLDRVPLLPAHEDALQHARKLMLGAGFWRAAKLSAMRDVLALAQISRLEVIGMDPTTELRVLVRMPCCVPCLPPGASELVVESQVELALRYGEEILRGPQPGYSIVEIRKPAHVHHPNTSAGPAQRLCLAASLPRGYPLREAIVASYGALTLQSVTVDERDPAGVMSPEAARFWQQRMDRIPLTREPFLAAPGSAVDTGGAA